MKLKEIVALVEGKVVCGEQHLDDLSVCLFF